MVFLSRLRGGRRAAGSRLFTTSVQTTCSSKPVGLSRELIAKYEHLRVPRYTSYPTAPHFGLAVNSDVVISWLKTLPEQSTGSLYVHIPFCREMCTYCGCHTRIVRTDAPIASYADTLKREIESAASRLPRPLSVGHIHFGGGTPSLLAPDDMTSLVQLMRTAFDVRRDAEVAIEIDPRTLTSEMTSALGQAGFTRASLGLQSFDPSVQKAINRVQSFEQTAAAAEGLRAAGVRKLNLDLIYGLPLQTVDACLDTVQQALRLQPDRLSVFGYAHMPLLKLHQSQIDPATLPGAAERLQQQQAIYEHLLGVGYSAIGFDHFARPGDSMAIALSEGKLRRNFQGYTTDTADTLLGFGTSAISKLPQGYAQNGTIIKSWRDAITGGSLPTARGYALTSEDRLRAEVISDLLCKFCVDVGVAAFSNGYPADHLDAGLSALAPLVTDGLCRVEGRTVTVTPLGRPLARSVAAAFDAYLQPPAQQPQGSKGSKGRHSLAI